MSSDILEAAQKARPQLVAELQQIQQRLSAVDSIISSFGIPSVTQGSNNLVRPANPSKKSTRIPKRDLVSAYTKEVILMHGGNARTPDIKKYIESKGIEMKGNTLSAYLSNDPDFVADRTKGWGLKDAQTNAAPVDAGAVDVVPSEQHPIPSEEKGGSHGVFS